MWCSLLAPVPSRDARLPGGASTRARATTVVAALFALVTAAAPARAQPVFDELSRATGLPSDYVLAIHQDRQGFVWFGTDSGVARYDGRRVETFTTDDGLAHNLVYSIDEGPGGTLYFGTFRGLSRFDGDRFHTFEDAPFGRSGVISVVATGRGDVAAQTAGGLFVRRADGRWHAFGGLPAAGRDRGIVALPDGRLLAGTNLLDPPAERRVRVLTLGPQGIAAAAVRLPPGAPIPESFLRLPDGSLLAYSSAGPPLRRYRLADSPPAGRTPGGARLVALGPPVAAGPVYRLAVDGDGRVFASSDGRVRLAGRTDGSAPRPRAILDHRAEALAVDYEGALWVGTFGAGAYRLRALHLRTLAPGPMLRLAEDARGHVWASGAGLVEVDPARGVTRTHAAGGGEYRALAASPRGLYASRMTELFGPARTGPATRARAMFQDGSWISGVEAATDTLWVGTYGAGVIRLAAGRVLDTLGTRAGLPTNMVEDVVRPRCAPGSAGGAVGAAAAGGAGGGEACGVWLLTRSDGAFRVRGRRLRAFGYRQGLPSSSVFAVYAARDGALWFGTDRGAARLAGGRMRTFGRADLAGMRTVAFFERAGDPGAVWTVSGRALHRIARDTLRTAGTFALLPDPAASINAALYHAATDRLYLATTRGLVEADLAGIGGPPLPPPRVAFRDVRVDGRRAIPRPTADGQTLGALGAGTHRVEIAFAPLSFAGGARAEYRIGGGDARGPWLDASAERRVAFPKLGPGRYRVEVRAVNAAGAASARTAALAFTIAAPVWRRPWFVALVAACLLAASAAAARRISTRRLRARVRALEAERRLQDERERISRDLHDHVGAQLAGITSAVELAGLSSGAGDAVRLKHYLGVLDGDARRAMAELRQTIWALGEEAMTSAAFAERLERYVREQARAFETPRLTFHADDAETPHALSPTQALHLFRMAQEAIANALRHANATTIAVTLRTRAGGPLVLTVLDDGVFRPPSGDGHAGPPGTLTAAPFAARGGHGLRNMARRAAEIGGTFTLTPGDAGTEARVELP